MKKLLVLPLLLLLTGCHKRDDNTSSYIVTGWSTTGIIGYDDPDAEKYKQQALENQHAAEEMKEYYGQYNEKYFDSRLPMTTVIGCLPHDEVRSLNAQGFTTRTHDGIFVIAIDETFCDGERVYNRILMHEMVHIDVWNDPEPDPHGPAFQADIHRILLAGGFDDLL